MSNDIESKKSLRELANPVYQVLEKVGIMQKALDDYDKGHKQLETNIELAVKDLSTTMKGLSNNINKSNNTSLKISLFIAALTSVGFATKIVSVGVTGREWIDFIVTWASTLG